MRLGQTAPKNMDEYIAGFLDDIRKILEQIRMTIRKAAPDAKETISNQMTIHSERQPGPFCCAQKPYRFLSYAKRELRSSNKSYLFMKAEKGR
jgi:hypothetical protein